MRFSASYTTLRNARQQSDLEDDDIGRTGGGLEVRVGRACGGGIPVARLHLEALGSNAAGDDVLELGVRVLVRIALVPRLGLHEHDGVSVARAEHLRARLTGRSDPREPLGV